jgi:hypothetical protein
LIKRWLKSIVLVFLLMFVEGSKIIRDERGKLEPLVSENTFSISVEARASWLVSTTWAASMLFHNEGCNRREATSIAVSHKDDQIKAQCNCSLAFATYTDQIRHDLVCEDLPVASGRDEYLPGL